MGYVVCIRVFNGFRVKTLRQKRSEPSLGKEDLKQTIVENGPISAMNWHNLHSPLLPFLDGSQVGLCVVLEVVILLASRGDVLPTLATCRLLCPGNAVARLPQSRLFRQ